MLELLTRYPTARQLARAKTEDLYAVPYLPHDRVERLLTAAGDSVRLPGGSGRRRSGLRPGPASPRHPSPAKTLGIPAHYGVSRLPASNRLDSIKGIGEVTAAILTAFILDIQRFDTPGQLVNYFGVLPVEASSGVERDGTPRGPKRYKMSPRGNDLVRRYLWMAALSAAKHNPACRALYARVRAKHPDKPSIAIGHVMRKLVHLTFAIWKTGQPFDPKHYPWGGATDPTRWTRIDGRSAQAASHTPDAPGGVGGHRGLPRHCSRHAGGRRRGTGGASGSTSRNDNCRWDAYSITWV